MTKVTGVYTKGALLIARGFGVGLSPIAPGTLGTALAVPLVCLQLFWPPLLFALFLLGFILAAVIISSIAENDIGRVDDPSIIIDEMAGFLVAMIFVPIGPWSLVVGFILFRAFDILKPPPIGLIDRSLSGGLGIVADDIVAGILANVVLQIVMRGHALL